MIYRIVADTVVLLHFAFILFVIGGGFLVIKWQKLKWLHIPAAVWGALIEFPGWVCPLTPLENEFRRAAGDSAYSGGFIEEYIIPIIYPQGLTSGIQIVLGVFVVIINLGIYSMLIYKHYK